MIKILSASTCKTMCCYSRIISHFTRTHQANDIVFNGKNSLSLISISFCIHIRSLEPPIYCCTHWSSVLRRVLHKHGTYLLCHIVSCWLQSYTKKDVIDSLLNLGGISMIICIIVEQSFNPSNSMEESIFSVWTLLFYE